MTTVTVTATHTAALARLGHALSDETRTRILLALREEDPGSSLVGERVSDETRTRILLA